MGGGLGGTRGEVWGGGGLGEVEGVEGEKKAEPTSSSRGGH